MKYRKHHLSKKICEHCNGELEVNSNAQKYCEEAECRDDRHFEKLYQKLGIEKYISRRIKQG
jgi:hypothetical protein